MFRILTLLLCLSSAAFALPQNSHVVVIGNNFGDPTEVGLRYAQSDARQVAEVLRRLGDVPSQNITTILDADAKTVQASLERVVSGLGSAAVLVVYYSGHADADALHLGGTRLGFDALRQQVRSASAQLRLLVVDACRSGGVSRVKGVKAGRTFTVSAEEDATAEGFAIITSSTANESSQESDALRGSFFSHHLVNGLRGAADKNDDGSITLSETYAYAYDGTVRSSGQTLDLQHPTYAWSMKGRSDVVLTRTKNARARSGTLTLRSPVVHLITDAVGGQVVAEVRPSQPGAVLSLPPRRYRVQERQARTYLNYEVRLDAGKTVDLANTPSQIVEYDRLLRKGGGDRAVVHGLMALGGARSELVPNEGAIPIGVLGYTLDTQWFSASLRGRLGTIESTAVDGRSPRRHTEYGVGLALTRAMDLDWLTASMGLLGEVTLHQQTFTESSAPDRSSTSGGFGAIFALERTLFGGASLRLEGGPFASVLRLSTPERGAEIATETASAVTWWVAGGLAWRL